MVKKNCADRYKANLTASGVFKIDPDGLQDFGVLCDQTKAGGGWTVFQKRLDGSVDFYRNWTEYQQGFGNLNGEFWLGLDKIHRLTSQINSKLRVELEDFDGNTSYAEFDTFAVADEAENYTLSVAGYKGSEANRISEGCLIFMTCIDSLEVVNTVPSVSICTTRNLRTKFRKCVPIKRNSETNAAFQKHLYH